ncbi:RNA-binding cell elongation regulator Jag/EloR [Anaeromicropila populeti]|uniref:RNA-binding protein KhpB n=1 Tax=Anaeromicropila populeti TaxID=37658 RepID=A0A1I6LMD9_9FIRM|nr:RNA-binding cell elongation regulator Jag/EloR [Anaeromicropila populeti]SFS04727.1 spoIIIJ-associated protein [Anaeromicropila populeti]
MDWVEFTAKTVDDAITEALIKLETTSDKVEWKVIEKESRGVLGLFSRPARITVRLKAEEQEEKVNVVENVISKTVGNAVSNYEAVASEFLKNVLREMKISANVETKLVDENQLDINIDGQDMGVLIGKRGQTLDSLQYLTSLVVNKESSAYIKVKIDTENYRERRKETLENLAKNIAFKVKRSKHSVSLEPMNPYERRIIHSALQHDKFVETHSEGEEPYRKVVVTLKSGVRDNSHRNNRKGYQGNYNSHNNSNRGNRDSRDNRSGTYRKNPRVPRENNNQQL